MGMTATHKSVRDQEYPPVVMEIEATGIHPMRDYIRRRKAAI